MATTSSFSSLHPCFGNGSRRIVGRLHLPVAPRANTRIRFAPAPAATPAMTPEEGLALVDRTLEHGVAVDMVGITGPGDPLATPETTLRTLRLVRDKYPDMGLCLTTVGMGGAPVAGELAALGLSHVTVLSDAVSAGVAEGLYAWIRPSTRTVPLPQAARTLVDEQRQAVAAFVEAGLTVKINTTLYPGHNADHVETIARTMAGLGASIMAVVPFWPGGEEGGKRAEAVSGPDMDLLDSVRERVAGHISLMPSWGECGRDLVGLEKGDASMMALAVASVVASATLPRPVAGRPNVAVASASGMDVDLHLGHAVKLLIYGPREDGLACLLETRDAPEPGGGTSRWETLADTLGDCFALLAASAGESPREILSRRGVAVLITEGEIEGTVDALYGGGRKGRGRK
ncbi:MAG: dinitrogenase iron-molybdenum cofactor biosynthesis protein [Pseudodesulfovibrio sp.]|uniref:Dinitrogenase iron-molybdenum cofactor biosynthesis protein n=1 Tax=Pseudodesulfovibrio aespoeensis (strain ATCC 700646 / DSM 10631 / Aspo-2) TaxID=643562 RepID=E6VSZ2_PSEA9|nr:MULTISPECIES: NifB/NifX family molybdenum-iron cluster-binding protein [Pseudodesulfovibrio]MBU4193189.1 dinitrogenase iron-molybdenum cofactor biosynthesis protein [Pseudomonadota bacterium]ADU62042.1 Dinitrogenase iron-molybdenum cofactor biosynthesis protein [Pseudodesulfovibrio aespoeensis Aspo-2]MBU4244687.1 dinitrogenase iron-molybdenum cofactor biosynthesis protein [Pseudomonadota bacterium]MBU4379776.1 dinitrogenase iron-molybdenum cofactor biosynthesis protein [Pseudomonadota bacter